MEEPETVPARKSVLHPPAGAWPQIALLARASSAMQQAKMRNIWHNPVLPAGAGGRPWPSRHFSADRWDKNHRHTPSPSTIKASFPTGATGPISPRRRGINCRGRAEGIDGGSEKRLGAGAAGAIGGRHPAGGGQTEGDRGQTDRNTGRPKHGGGRLRPVRQLLRPA